MREIPPPALDADLALALLGVATLAGPPAESDASDEDESRHAASSEDRSAAHQLGDQPSARTQADALLARRPDFATWLGSRQRRFTNSRSDQPTPTAEPLAQFLVRMLVQGKPHEPPLGELLASSTDDPVHPAAILTEGLAALVERHRLRDAFREAVEDATRSAIYELAYGASHEINNPLATIRLRAERLARLATEPDTQTTARAIKAQVERAHGMLAAMMHLADPPPPSPTRVDWVATVEAVLSGLAAKFPDILPPIHLAVAQEMPLVWADPVQATVLVDELLRNAVEATTRGATAGTVLVRLGWADLGGLDGARVSLPDGVEAVTWPPTAPESKTSRSLSTRLPTLPTIVWPRRVTARLTARRYGVITVTDTGPGLSDRERRHAFAPYFSGREAGRGHGFGLCRSRVIVDLAGGDIGWAVTASERSPLDLDDRANSPTTGATIWALLPAWDEPPRRERRSG